MEPDRERGEDVGDENTPSNVSDVRIESTNKTQQEGRATGLW